MSNKTAKIDKLFHFRNDLLDLIISYEESEKFKKLLEFVDEPLRSRLETSLEVFFKDYKEVQKGWLVEALEKFEKGIDKD